MGRLNPSRETKFPGTYGDRGTLFFPCSADHEQDWQPYPVDPYSAICDDHTSLSHTHYWYEVGMLKVPANIWSNTTDFFGYY